MKLLTELQDRMNGNGKHPVFNGEGMRPERAFQHDVMAAHALLQAMEQIGGGELYKELADELMAEWGFE